MLSERLFFSQGDTPIVHCDLVLLHQMPGTTLETLFAHLGQLLYLFRRAGVAYRESTSVRMQQLYKTIGHMLDFVIPLSLEADIDPMVFGNADDIPFQPVADLDGLEDLEERLLSSTDVNPSIEEIQQYRRNFRLIKRSILPLKEQFSKLFHTENNLIHKASRPFYNDVNDHLQFVLQTLEGCRDMISALLDLYLTNNDRQMNNIMKQLTIVSTIFIPLTFLAGIWGMNFKFMPELDWKFGYLFAWLLMLLLGTGLYFYFRRKKWY